MAKTVKTDEIAESVQSFVSLKSSIYSVTTKNRPKIPKKIEDLILYGEYTKTIDGDEFLLHDENESGRILVSIYFFVS